MQDACHMNFVIDLAVESLWLRASERGIRRFEARFLMGTQNFLFFPRSSFFNLSLLQYYLGKELRFFLSASLKKTSQGSVLSLDLPLSLF